MQFLFSFLSLTIFGALLSVAAIPFSPAVAAEIAIACVILLLLLKWVPGKTAHLFFVTLCAWVVIRYLSWRIVSFPTEGSLIETVAASLLLAAEFYGVVMLLLGLFVNAMPLERRPVALPEDPSTWPTVDVYIPTYSEPVSVVSRTLVAATDIDYPKDKLRIYVLDDGYPRSLNPKTDPDVALELAHRTEELKALCLEMGATWLTRENNRHAKSGNMNAAMQQTEGDLILVLDADHVPTRDILKNTVGLFIKDKRLATVQTPHFFVNADPVEKNLSLFNRMPSENDMFYKVVQKGLDLWNTSFFCGSAAVIRRRAVEDIGGFSTESITEDASTSIKLHQAGWNSAYIGIPMVAGLQPETFAGFTVQRLRWAMGMMQILLKQNPLFIRGLALGQRIAYLSVTLFWAFPFARTVFYVSPLLAIFFNLTVYPVGLDNFWMYTAPYLLAVILSFHKMFGKVRRFLISEVYETLQGFYALPALVSTILRPNAPSFKVTPKGELLNKEYISEFNAPFYFFFALTVAGLCWGLLRLMHSPELAYSLGLSLVWATMNLLLLGACLGVLMEKVQMRAYPRIELNEKVSLNMPGCEARSAVILDSSETSCRVRFSTREMPAETGTARVGFQSLAVDAKVQSVRSAGEHRWDAVLVFLPTTPHEKRIISRTVYGSSSRWSEMWAAREENAGLLSLLWTFIKLAFKGLTQHLRVSLKPSGPPSR